VRAIVQQRYGGPETLEVAEIERPTAGGGEVLVRVQAAALNPTDHVVMRGFVRPQTGWLRPKSKQQVRGFDAAGTVEAVGEDVTDLTVGDAVFGSCRGSLAEYAVGNVEKGVRRIGCTRQHASKLFATARETRKAPFHALLRKPSNGLEPLTPPSFPEQP
jgi:NADPH:quinone reductase-like Zn-dependent oxidoreductase